MQSARCALFQFLKSQHVPAHYFGFSPSTAGGLLSRPKSAIITGVKLVWPGQRWRPHRGLDFSSSNDHSLLSTEPLLVQHKHYRMKSIAAWAKLLLIGALASKSRLCNHDSGERPSKSLLCHIGPLVSSQLCHPAVRTGFIQLQDQRLHTAQNFQGQETIVATCNTRLARSVES